MPETNADLISIDRVNMVDIMNKSSTKLRIIGNYDTSSLAFSSPDDVANGVEQMVRHSMNAPRGYVAATGCEVPVHTPGENIIAFMNAAKENGWYWD